MNNVDSRIVAGEWLVLGATCSTFEDFAKALLYPGKCWIPRNGHGPLQFPVPDPWLSHSPQNAEVHFGIPSA